MAFVKVECIVLQYRKILSRELIRHQFLKNDFSKSKQSDQQIETKLRQKIKQRSGTGLSKTRMQKSSSIVFVKNRFV